LARSRKAMFDPKVVRKDFPVLERRVHGDKPLVWLDNASTSQKPRKVIDTLVDFYEHHNSNVHRGVYQLAERVNTISCLPAAPRNAATFARAPS